MGGAGALAEAGAAKKRNRAAAMKAEKTKDSMKFPGLRSIDRVVRFILFPPWCE